MLAANPDFYGEGPHLERLIIKYVPDLTVLFTQFQTGDIDYIGLQGITADHYEEATKLADRVVTPVPQPFIENIACNLGLPQLKERAVREALYYGMDKQSIIEAIYYGLPKPSESFLPQQSWAYNPDLPKHEYNLDKARQMLDEAGWMPGPDGVREKDGVRLEFVNSTTAGNHVREHAATPATELAGHRRQDEHQQSAAGRDVGRLLDAVEVRDGDGRHRLHDRPRPGRQRLFASKSIGAQGGTGQNTCQYSSPEVDKLLQERGKHVRPRQARPDLPPDAGGDAATCPTCRSSTRRSRAPRPASRASSPTFVQMNTYNCNHGSSRSGPCSTGRPALRRPA